jgi:hypothetical protein
MDPIFQEPKEPEVFTMPNQAGTGYKTIDQFISDRTALMGDATKVLDNVVVAQQNVTNLDHASLRRYIDGLVNKSMGDMETTAVNRFAEAGDVDGGVKAVGEIRDIANEPTEVRRLARAAVQYLNQYKPHSLAREIARRQYTMLLFAKKMEEVGITPENTKDKLLAFGGTIIPGRRTAQEITTDFSVEQSVKNLHAMPDDQFFEALPDIMDTVMQISGENPLYFMERMETYLNPDDITWLKVNLGLDVVDAVTLVAAIPKLMRVLKIAAATNTPIKIVRDAGDIQQAARLNAAALSGRCGFQYFPLWRGGY